MEGMAQVSSPGGWCEETKKKRVGLQVYSSFISLNLLTADLTDAPAVVA